MNDKLVSVIIRTLNEERYLEKLLLSVKNQNLGQYQLEIIIVDSGSQDRTLEIAKKFNARITYIKKEDFTFGRSLNYGCRFANGKYLIFVSGHCIPVTNNWLKNLVDPLDAKRCQYVYGRQIGGGNTKFSESMLFEKYYPEHSRIPQEGFFCNNANSAITKEVWSKYLFDEDLTGCEDMFLAKKLLHDECIIGYESNACVFHLHDETWKQTKTRYEREALAMQRIMPEVSVTFFDALKFIFIGIVKDFKSALSKKVFLKNFLEIIMFRLAQYVGTYIGNQKQRKISKEMKQKYYYPRITDIDLK